MTECLIGEASAYRGLKDVVFVRGWDCDQVTTKERCLFTGGVHKAVKVTK